MKDMQWKTNPGKAGMRVSGIATFIHSGGSSIGQNKLPQLIFGYIYILKYLQSNFIGKILFFRNS